MTTNPIYGFDQLIDPVCSRSLRRRRPYLNNLQRVIVYTINTLHTADHRRSVNYKASPQTSSDCRSSLSRPNSALGHDIVHHVQRVVPRMEPLRSRVSSTPRRGGLSAGMAGGRLPGLSPGWCHRPLGLFCPGEGLLDRRSPQVPTDRVVVFLPSPLFLSSLTSDARLEDWKKRIPSS
jgi:hypothetical protein